jgi:undecaprenyl-diphosphatase
MMTFLYQWDLFFVHYVNQVWIGPRLDFFMAAMSDYNLFRIPLAVAIIALLVFGRFREHTFLALMFFCLLIGDGVIMNGLKHAVNRPRPREALTGVRVVALDGVAWSHPTPETTAGGHSFPSSHVGNNVALALVATTLYGRWASILWLWAALMGYARVYVGAHYPSDVLGGVAISLIYSWAIIRLGEWAWHRYAPRLTPKFYDRHPSLLRPKPGKSPGTRAKK